MSKYDYNERRQISYGDLRALCIKNNWYTSGNNEEYAKLLERVQSITNLNTNDLVEIAADIIKHTERMTFTEDIESVFFDLNEISYSCLYKEETRE